MNNGLDDYLISTWGQWQHLLILCAYTKIGLRKRMQKKRFNHWKICGEGRRGNIRYTQVAIKRELQTWQVKKTPKPPKTKQTNKNGGWNTEGLPDGSAWLELTPQAAMKQHFEFDGQEEATWFSMIWVLVLVVFWYVK